MRGGAVGYNPLDWNRDGRVGVGDGAFTLKVLERMSQERNSPRNRGGCSCGCLVAFVCGWFLLFYIMATLGGS